MVPQTNKSAIVSSMGLISTTKDSVHIKWKINDLYTPLIEGYKIDYQAHGSSIQQSTDFIEDGKTDFDLSQLHENTYYKICVNVISNHSYMVDRECIKATTSVDSLSVALGSTFGAFLGLGFVVLCVFLAKWTQTQKLKYQMKHMNNSEDTADKNMQNDGDIEMSDVSLQVNDGTLKASTLSSKSSQVSGNSEHDSFEDESFENGAISGAELMLDEQFYEPEDIDDDLLELGVVESLQYANGNIINGLPVQNSCHEHDIEIHKTIDSPERTCNQTLQRDNSIGHSNARINIIDSDSNPNSNSSNCISYSDSKPDDYDGSNSNWFNEAKPNSYGGARPKQYITNSINGQHPQLIELPVSDPCSKNTINQCPNFKW